MRLMDDRDLLTIVIAAYNEAETLPLLQPRLAVVLDGLARDANVDCRVLYVDDGSDDGTWPLSRPMASRVSRLPLRWVSET